MSRFISTSTLRTLFSAAMSEMYRIEVPLYEELLDIVASVNAEVLRKNDTLRNTMIKSGEIDRLNVERHGAIRVGSAEEIAVLRRIFALLGMFPVGYYDLAPAGVPVHSTAFRPIEDEDLQACPFRIFTSLLRLELIEDTNVREQARLALQGRHILSPVFLQKIEKAEKNGGVLIEDTEEFIAEILNIFRWHSQAIVSLSTYHKMHDTHRLLADIAAFQGPHINHLTPRVLDIDAAQQKMQRRGLKAKKYIEGPPPRAVEILLRQTSFHALEEKIFFPDDKQQQNGTHTARFGEIEQRGMALTPKGRHLYDTCLQEARYNTHNNNIEYMVSLQNSFKKFPDTLKELRQSGLGYFRYTITDTNTQQNIPQPCSTLEELLEHGLVKATPILYEDFLPISAAGIFQSNLGGATHHGYNSTGSQTMLEEALGCAILDPFALYGEIQNTSLSSIKKHFSL